ncbi:uncharacterized protein N7515_008899 [Penicillium bovifimosum]|uniref:Uncharacterized protein n=1 Tax=Penicillium bovifimosum TaxID=126998 RepID=A0A9W9GP47_9EURO|nr:uncharacterized protein N7515_008899 [Penicillium bovifimosum]KAJ5125074.1 hypothetical protein N7515_008899 [Penicillium bovifimosum]
MIQRHGVCPIAAQFEVMVLFANIRTCMQGRNVISDRYGLAPPSVEEYLGLDRPFGEIDTLEECIIRTSTAILDWIQQNRQESINQKELNQLKQEVQGLRDGIDGINQEV